MDNSSTTALSAAAAAAAAANTPVTLGLTASQVLPLSVGFDLALTLRVVQGVAEIDGFELADRLPYSFTGARVGVHTFHGCTLEISSGPLGPTATSHGSGLLLPPPPPSPPPLIPLLLSQHRRHTVALIEANAEFHRLRSLRGSAPPRIMLVGPRDCGKTTVARTLVNYSLRSGHSAMLVDLNPECSSISVPGTLAAMPISYALDPSFGFLISTPSTVAAGSGSAPHVLWLGTDTTPTSSNMVYVAQVRALAKAVELRMAHDAISVDTFYASVSASNNCREDSPPTLPSEFVSGGIIIDCPAPMDDALVSLVADSFKVTHVLVIGDTEAHASTCRVLGSNICVIDFPRIHGAQAKDPKYRKYLLIHKIREYFYGVALHHRMLLSPQNITVPPSVLNVGIILAKPGQEPLIGIGGSSCENTIRFVPVSDSNLLVHSILGVSSEDDCARVPLGSVIGFAYISEYNETRKKLSVLIPFPGRLPKTNLILGSIKWIELT